MPFVHDKNLIEEHRQWLAQFDPRHTKNWQQDFENNQDGAMCEAAFRRLLQINGLIVEPNRSLTNNIGGPDFRCKNNGQHFYIEATCIPREVASQEVWLPERLADITTSRVTGDLTWAVWEAAKEKTPQCANQDAPTLLAIGTFHQSASQLCVEECLAEKILVGHTRYVVSVPKKPGPQPSKGKIMTELKSAVGLRLNSDHIIPVRRTISGLILGGLGIDPVKIYGVLLPEPARPFDRKLLPKIPFCRLQSGYKTGPLNTKWI